ncbi:MAG: type IV pilus twitching motility protein PilT [Syntrophomonadaceae bacterium]|nr:type IV pilus twitching motility protein PilT [Syntrophomonadaceae bacterium]
MAQISAFDIIRKGMEIGASDVHITVHRPPTYRVNGELISGEQTLNAQDTRRLGEEIILNDKIRQTLKENGQADFSNSFSGVGRFRVNLYIQRGSWAVAIRLFPVQVPDLDSLNLPPAVAELATARNGMVLVTGVTGSGKSTTLAAMINLLNHTKNYHILTLEDPIEYWHCHGKCIINQREIGIDTMSFAGALRSALRQDPDVILVGEMRDLETISTALTAAETGHLIFATLHSGSAAQTIERIVDVFPPYQQAQIRLQLANCLEGIITQQLLPRADGKGRIVAAEILLATAAVKNLIRENKVHQIYSAMQTGSAAGMVTMEKSIKLLYQRGIISLEEATRRAGKDV